MHPNCKTSRTNARFAPNTSTLLGVFARKAKEHDTVEHQLAGSMFYEGILLVGVQMPSSNPITKYVVTNLITTIISRGWASFPKGESPSCE